MRATVVTDTGRPHGMGTREATDDEGGINGDGDNDDEEDVDGSASFVAIILTSAPLSFGDGRTNALRESLPHTGGDGEDKDDDGNEDADADSPADAATATCPPFEDFICGHWGTRPFVFSWEDGTDCDGRGDGESG